MRQRVLRLALVALVIAACGDHDVNLLAPAPQSSSAIGETITITAGDGQIGLPNAPLRAKLKFIVRDASNNPLAGARGTITVNGGGSTSRAAFKTGVSGEIIFAWTLGSSGPQTVDVALTGGTPQVTYNATVVPTNSDLIITTGNNQSAQPGQTLAQTARVKLSFPNGDPVPGMDVKWFVKSGDGTLLAAVTKTNSNGLTNNTWTLGWGSVSQQIMAKVEGVDSVTFTATARVNGYTFTYRTPTGGSGVADSAYIVQIEVKDSTGAPVVGARGTFSIVSGGGSLSKTALVTTTVGRSITNWTLGPITGGEQRMRATIGVLGSRDLVFQYAVASCSAPINEANPMEYAITDSYYRILPNFTDQIKAGSLQNHIACIYSALRGSNSGEAISRVNAARAEMTQPYEAYADPADAGAFVRLLDELALLLGI